MDKKKTVKIQVNLSQDLVEKIDKIANDSGLSRSGICGYWIQQQVQNQDIAMRWIQQVLTPEALTMLIDKEV